MQKWRAMPMSFSRKADLEMSLIQKVLVIASVGLLSCGGSSFLPRAPGPDADTAPAVDAGASDGIGSSGDVAVLADALPLCTTDEQCVASSMCVGQTCIDRCAPSPISNLVKNPGFDRDIWTLADKDRGVGPRLPRWDALDSASCGTSGSLAVSDRTAFSPPMEVGPPGTRYYWGFRIKLPRPTAGPYCEIHWCTDISCTFFNAQDVMGPGVAGREPTGQWESLYSLSAEVPTMLDPPGTPTPYAQIACFGYQEKDAPEVLFDRFYFSKIPVPF
jgi:hypothetical protein